MAGGAGPGQPLQRGSSGELPPTNVHGGSVAVLQEPVQQRPGLQTLHHVSTNTRFRTDKQRLLKILTVKFEPN